LESVQYTIYNIHKNVYKIQEIIFMTRLLRRRLLFLDFLFSECQDVESLLLALHSHDTCEKYARIITIARKLIISKSVLHDILRHTFPFI